MPKPFEEWPEVMTIPDVIECTGIDRNDVYQIFKLPDFPLVAPNKKRFRVVGKLALKSWLNRGISV